MRGSVVIKCRATARPSVPNFAESQRITSDGVLFDNPSGWRMEVDPAGQQAVTDWRILGRGDGLTWLELRPRTGRTHQIRAHAAALGCPLLGDAVYGGGDGRLHLLAREIRLALDPEVFATAPVPAHMRTAFAATNENPKR